MQLLPLSELSASQPKRAPQHREFVQAATITDLPGELISALSQGLSQFGINLPPMPTSLLDRVRALDRVPRHSRRAWAPPA